MTRNEQKFPTLTDHDGLRQALERYKRIEQAHRESLGRLQDEANEALAEAEAARRKWLAAMAEAQLHDDVKSRRALIEAKGRAEEAERKAAAAQRAADQAFDLHEGLAAALADAEADLYEQKEAAFTSVMPSAVAIHREAIKAVKEARDTLVTAFQRERQAAKAIEQICTEVHVARAKAKGTPEKHWNINCNHFVGLHVPTWAPSELYTLEDGRNFARWLAAVEDADKHISRSSRRGA